MVLKIERGTLSGLVTRSSIGENGVRVIETLKGEILKNRENNGGFLGWLGGFISAVGFSFVTIYEWLVAGINYIWNFNWNISDKEIDQRIDSAWQSVQERAFGILGRSLGWLVCGAVPGSIMFVFNEGLGTAVLMNVGDEAVQDLFVEFESFLGLLAQKTVESGFLWAYKNIRRLIKQDKFLRSLPGWAPILDSWGKDGAKEWSFAQKEQEAIESIEDEDFRDKVQELASEFKDACYEAGYVVAEGLDEWIAQKSLDTLPQEETRTIRYYHDRENESEFIVLDGNTNEIREEVLEVEGQVDLLNNRDIGTTIVNNDEENVVITSNGIEIMLEFFSYEKPPYWTNERRKNLVRSRLTIPNCKRSLLTWDNIRQLFPNKAFDKGEVRGQANLDNGRQLVCHGDSEVEAEKLLEKMATLTEAEIVYPLEFKTRKKFPVSGHIKPRAKAPQYLGYLHIINYPKISKYERLGQLKKVEGSKVRVEMYMDANAKPSWIDGVIKEAIKSGDDDD